MSQTTDHTRGKSSASVPGRKTRSVRTPGRGSSPRSSVPSPPKRRRPLINLEPEKMPSAWQGKQIDAAWVWDPVLTELKKSGHVVLSSADTAQLGKPTYDLGTASNEFIEKNPEFLTQWAKAQDYAVKLVQDDPDKAAESIAAELGVSTDEAKALFAGLEYLPASDQAGPDHLGGKFAEDLHTTAEFLLGQGGIESVADAQVYADGVDATPAEEASK